MPAREQIRTYGRTLAAIVRLTAGAKPGEETRERIHAWATNALEQFPDFESVADPIASLEDTLSQIRRVWSGIDRRDEQKMIRVWAWTDAPTELRDLSTHGGDEDWVAWVPPGYGTDWIPWAEESTPFGICSTSNHRMADGALVIIGAHA